MDDDEGLIHVDRLNPLSDPLSDDGLQFGRWTAAQTELPSHPLAMGADVSAKFSAPDALLPDNNLGSQQAGGKRAGGGPIAASGAAAPGVQPWDWTTGSAPPAASSSAAPTSGSPGLNEADAAMLHILLGGSDGGASDSKPPAAGPAQAPWDPPLGGGRAQPQQSAANPWRAASLPGASMQPQHSAGAGPSAQVSEPLQASTSMGRPFGVDAAAAQPGYMAQQQPPQQQQQQQQVQAHSTHPHAPRHQPQQHPQHASHAPSPQPSGGCGALSAYHGVVQLPRPSPSGNTWGAILQLGRERMAIGTFPSATAAAQGHDVVVLHLRRGGPAPLAAHLQRTGSAGGGAAAAGAAAASPVPGALPASSHISSARKRQAQRASDDSEVPDAKSPRTLGGMPAPVAPPKVPVVCGALSGMFDPATVLFTLGAGVQRTDTKGITGTEFERRAGQGSRKKWRNSVFVCSEPGGEPVEPLGSWLERYEREQQQKLAPEEAAGGAAAGGGAGASDAGGADAAAAASMLATLPLNFPGSSYMASMVQHVLSRVQNTVLRQLLRLNAGGQRPMGQVQPPVRVALSHGGHSPGMAMQPLAMAPCGPSHQHSGSVPGAAALPALNLDVMGGGSSSSPHIPGLHGGGTGLESIGSMPASSSLAASAASSVAPAGEALIGSGWGLGNGSGAGQAAQPLPGQGMSSWYEPQHPLLSTGAPAEFL